MLSSFCLILLASFVGSTSGQLLIDTIKILETVRISDSSSLIMASKTCNSLAFYSPMMSSTWPSLSTLPPPSTAELCSFQPDYNFLCTIMNVVDWKCIHRLENGLPLINNITFSPSFTSVTSLFATVSRGSPSWQCTIGQDKLCDGFSMCLTDECQCADIDVFYCADGVGCIAHANVCDGREDCRDGSDECMCDDVIQCTVQNHTYCVPRTKYCNERYFNYPQCTVKHDPVECLDQQFSRNMNMNNKTLSSVDQCQYDYENLEIMVNIDNFSSFKIFCLQHCDRELDFFCNITMYQWAVGYRLNCTHLNPLEVPYIHNLCDGVIDCVGGLDEMHCPGRYYCNSNVSRSQEVEWIAIDKHCDNKKDCSNGKDECDNCTGKRTAGIASDQFLVQGRGMRGYMIVVSVLIVTMNVCAGVEIYRKETNSRPGRVDKLFLITLCAYDALMGLCVGFTFFKSIVYSGNYCLKDNEWRASLQCKFLGCCFTLAAHGSLLTVSMISLTRCYKVAFDRTIRVRVIAAVTAITFTFNALHSALPILPLSGVQDVFRASMTFSDNPFATEYNHLEMKRKYRVYKGENVTFPDTYTMLDQLNNISSKPGLFDPEELGYYSYSPLCIHNIYGTQASLVVYKVVYMSVIVALLIATTISYITIVCNVYRTSQMAQQGAANQVNNNNAELSIKVMFVIGSQLFCWITVVILMAVYGLVKDIYAPDLLYELTAIVFLPMNSYLNPVFNSSLYRKIMTLVKKMYSLMNELRTKHGNDVEPANATINRNVGTTAM